VRFRTLFIAGVGASLLLASACGSSGDERSKPRTTSPATTTTLTVLQRFDQEAVRSVTLAFMHAVAHGDGATACALLTPAAQEKTASDPRDAGSGTTCESGIVEVARRLTVSGLTTATENSRVTNVEIRDDHARVEIETAGKAGSADLDRVNGQWLVGTLPQT
jgi:hypothetical protein